MSKTIEVESCMDCRFRATDEYNHKICNLGIGELALVLPKEPPADCPLREGSVTVRLKGTEPDYKAEVLKVYPDAVISKLETWHYSLFSVIRKSCVPLSYFSTTEQDAWKSAYEHMKMPIAKSRMLTKMYESGYKKGFEDAQENRWTNQDMLDLITGLLNYTHESHTVLGHDGRDAEYYFNLFVERKNNGQ